MNRKEGPSHERENGLSGTTIAWKNQREEEGHRVVKMPDMTN